MMELCLSIRYISPGEMGFYNRKPTSGRLLHKAGIHTTTADAEEIITSVSFTFEIITTHEERNQLAEITSKMFEVFLSNPMDISELQISRTPFSTGIGLNLPTAKRLGSSKPARRKSDTLINNAGKNLPPFKDIFDRCKKPTQGNMTSKLLQGKITSKQLYSYLEDAKASLQLDTKLGYLKPQQMKRYNLLSLGEIETLWKEEKIDPAVVLLLKSADGLRIPQTEPKLSSTFSRGSTPSESHSVWSTSDTISGSKSVDSHKAGSSIRKDEEGSSSVVKMTIGSVPTAGRIITDKGTFTTCELSARTPPSSADQLISCRALLYAADEMLSKVGEFEEKPRISSRNLKSCKIFRIPQTSSLLIDHQTLRPDIISSQIACQITKDDSQKRDTQTFRLNIPVGKLQPLIAKDDSAQRFSKTITMDQCTQTPIDGISTNELADQIIHDGFMQRTDIMHRNTLTLMHDIPAAKLPRQIPTGKLPSQIPAGKLPGVIPACDLPQQIPDGKLSRQNPDGVLSRQNPDRELSRQIPDDKLSRQTLDGEHSRQIPHGKLSRQIPDGELSRQILDGELSRQIPDGELSRQIPYRELSRQIPDDKLPRQIPYGELSRQIPDGELSRQIPDDKLSRQIPDGKLSRQNPDGVLSRQNPDGELSRQIPDGELSRQIPDDKLSRQTLDGEHSRQIPHGKLSRQIPDGELSRQILDGELSRQIPDGELSRQIPYGELSRQIPDDKLPRQIPYGELSRQIPDGELSRQIPDDKLSRQIPDGELPRQIPDGELPRQIPDGELSRQIPDGELSRQIPDGELSYQIPDGKLSRQIPDGELPLQILDGELPRQIPDGELSRQIQDGELARQTVDGELSRQTVDGELSGQIPDGGLSRQIPDGELSRQSLNGELSYQIPHGKLSRQIPDGGLSRQIPDGELSRQISDDKRSRQILDGKLSRQIPDGELSRHVSDGKLSCQIPDDKRSRQIPDGELSRQIPGRELSRQVSDGKLSCQIPDDKLSRQIQDGELSRQIPADKLSRQTVDGELSRQIPDGELSRQIPADKLSRQTVDGELSGQTPDGKLAPQIPAFEVPPEIPADKLACQISASELTHQIPAAEIAHEIFADKVTTQIQAREPARKIPAGEQIHEFPTGELAPLIPAGKHLSQVLVGEFAHQITMEVSEGQIPADELRHQMPTEELARHIPSAELPCQIPAEKLVRQITKDGSIRRISKTVTLDKNTQTIWPDIPTGESAEQIPVGKYTDQIPSGEIACQITEDGSIQRNYIIHKDKQILKPDIPTGKPAGKLAKDTIQRIPRSRNSRSYVQTTPGGRLSRQFTKDGLIQRKTSEKTDHLIPEKLARTITTTKDTDLTDEIEKFKHFLKQPSLPPDELAKNLMLHKKPTLERSSFSRRKQHTSATIELHPEESASKIKKQKTEHKFQDLKVTGKELSSHHKDDVVSVKADYHLLRKPDDAIENVFLDEDIACSETLEMILDNYEKHNQISEEVPTQDLESFIENAKEHFQDYFREQNDSTGNLMKYVTFSLKDQDNISKEQALLLMKQALIDPQIAELLKTGKKEDFLAKLKLTQLVSSLKEDDTTHPDDSKTEKVDIVPGEVVDLKEADDEKDDEKSGLGKVVDAAEGECNKLNGEAMEEEKITVIDEIAIVPKDVTAEEVALKEAAEVEKLKISSSSIPWEMYQNSIPIGKSESVSISDTSSITDGLRKDVDMPTEGESVTGANSDIALAISKIPDSLRSVDSTPTVVPMVYGDSSDAATRVSAEGGIEGLPTVPSEGPPTVLGEGPSTELPTISAEGPSTVSKEASPTVPTKGHPTVSAEVLPAVSTEGLSTKGEPLKSTTTSEERLSTASKLDEQSEKFTHFKDQNSKLGRVKPKLSIPPIKKSLSKEEIAVVDELLTKYDPSTAKDTSLGATSTISSAYDAMTTDGSFLKLSLTGVESTDAGDSQTAENAFERAQMMSKNLSQKYGLEESLMTPLPYEEPKEKPKGKRLSQSDLGKSKKKKPNLEEKKPLPDIGAGKKLERSDSKIMKRKTSASKSDLNKQAAKAEKQQLLSRKSKRKATDEAKLKSMFKDQDAKEDFIQMGLEKILLMAKDGKQQSRREYDPAKKQFRNPIEVRDILHKRREQVNQLIMGMSDEKGMELENMMQSQHELFDELETYEDEEINETLSLLTKVLHLDLGDKSPEEKETEEPEIPKKEKDVLFQVKEAELVSVVEEEEKEKRVETPAEKEEKKIEEPRKISGKPEIEFALPVPSQEALDESLFRNALLKMKTLNIFNAIKALGITNPQMKDFDDYIAQNRLTEFMDPEEIQHLRKAASEMFVFKGKSKNKGRKKSLRSSSTIKAKDLKNVRSISDNQMTSKIELEVSEAVMDVERIQKQAALANMKQELEMLSFEQEITEPYIFSYYVQWPETPKTQNKPGKKK